jgi:hypothetical protein
MTPGPGEYEVSRNKDNRSHKKGQSFERDKTQRTPIINKAYWQHNVEPNKKTLKKNGSHFKKRNSILPLIKQNREQSKTEIKIKKNSMEQL